MFSGQIAALRAELDALRTTREAAEVEMQTLKSQALSAGQLKEGAEQETPKCMHATDAGASRGWARVHDACTDVHADVGLMDLGGVGFGRVGALWVLRGQELGKAGR